MVSRTASRIASTPSAGTVLKENTEAGDANRQAIIGKVKAADQHREAMFDQKVETHGVNEATRQSIEAFAGQGVWATSGADREYDSEFAG